MRCSSCEPLLDLYVDGALPQARQAAVGAHVRACDACRGLYERLRIVDALLETHKPVGVLPADFTVALMQQVHAMPAPPPFRQHLFRAALAYLAAAWVAVAIAIVTIRSATLQPALHSASAVFGGIYDGVTRGAHAMWPVAPIAVSVGVTILTVDALLLVAIVLFYRNVRPRLAAALAPSRDE